MRWHGGARARSHRESYSPTSTGRFLTRSRRGLPRRSRNTVLCHAAGCRRESGHPDHRRPHRQDGRSRPRGMDRTRRSSVRLLPVRTNHVCRRPARSEPATKRRGNRRRHAGQHLPVRDLLPDSKCDPPGFWPGGSQRCRLIRPPVSRDDRSSREVARWS